VTGRSDRPARVKRRSPCRPSRNRHSEDRRQAPRKRFTFDVGKFVERMDDLLSMLSGAVSGIEHHIEAAQEDFENSVRHFDGDYCDADEDCCEAYGPNPADCYESGDE
jgi:hypothetical protein